MASVGILSCIAKLFPVIDHFLYISPMNKIPDLYQINAPMQFSNTENRCVKINGTDEKVWLSRSCAVVGIIAMNGYVLMVRRGPKCPDEVGKWVLPCGYVDWDENLTEAMYRETYEETGINLLNFRRFLKDQQDSGKLVISVDSFGDADDYLRGEGTPTFVRSNPKRDGKQNISMYMCLSVETSDELEFTLPMENMNVVDPGEVAEVKWMDIAQIRTLEMHGLIGFGHTKQTERLLRM